jgi:hypothetical protein
VSSKDEGARQVHFPIARIEVAAQFLPKLFVRVALENHPEVFALPPSELERSLLRIANVTVANVGRLIIREERRRQLRTLFTR